MKTIAYKDRAGGGLRIFNPPIEWRQNTLDNPYPVPVHLQRIMRGLNELRHTGNINIYLVHGNRIRLIQQKGI